MYIKIFGIEFAKRRIEETLLSLQKSKIIPKGNYVVKNVDTGPLPTDFGLDDDGSVKLFGLDITIMNCDEEIYDSEWYSAIDSIFDLSSNEINGYSNSYMNQYTMEGQRLINVLQALLNEYVSHVDFFGTVNIDSCFMRDCHAAHNRCSPEQSITSLG